jgi:hypothetical protein
MDGPVDLIKRKRIPTWKATRLVKQDDGVFDGGK